MFEGFTMPPLTIDSERNAMRKQVQCRPFAISDEHAAEDSPEQQVVRAFASFSSPRAPSSNNLSLAAATAFTESFLERRAKAETEAAEARTRFSVRQEFPSLWETEELHNAMAEKVQLAESADFEMRELDTAGCLPGAELRSPAAATLDEETTGLALHARGDGNVATAAMYSMLAMERIANMEGLARARQTKPKKRRDTDAHLQEQFVSVTTAGENDLDAAETEDVDEDLQPERPKQPSEVFQPITFRPSSDEQRKLLQLGLQGRKNKYTTEFLQETWMQMDAFDLAAAAPSKPQPLAGFMRELESLDPAAQRDGSFCLFSI